jgi:VCBS repeat-containing protein
MAKKHDPKSGKSGEKIVGTPGNDKLVGTKGNDKIFGGAGDDKLYGGKGDDKLYGGKGNDKLYGGSGKDKINGGGGDDVIHGGAGADVLIGGKGNDVFVYLSAAESNLCAWDRILDFKQGHDKIDLSALLGATDLIWGNQTATINGAWFNNVGSKTFVYADTTGDGNADLKIELKHTPGLQLKVSDFIGVSEITGPPNNPPVLSDTADPAEVLELGDASAQDLAPIAGSFSVTDPDVGNALSASVVGGPTVLLDGAPFVLPAGAAALTAAGAFVVANPGAATGASQPVDYTYDPGPANLDFLRAGQNLTIAYAVRVSDGTANSNTQDVTFAITGTNDAPVLSDTTDPAAVLELANASAQDLAPINGSFPVTDFDIGDTLTASVVDGPTVLLDGAPFVLPAGAAALTAAGAFVVANPGAATGASQPVNYTYDPAAANLDFLLAGQNLTITYTVRVSDGTTNSNTQDVAFTIIGTNEPPVANPDNVVVGSFFVVVPEWALLTNDTDADGDLIDVTDPVPGPGALFFNHATGGVGVIPNGTVSFVAFANPTTFTYKATDGVADSAAAPVTVTRDTAGDVDGTAGNDILIGDGNNNVLNGNDGDDILIGAGGSDTLTGGDGNDYFWWGATPDFGDIITDFTPGSDKLVFDVPAIQIGNEDTTVTFLEGDDAAINVVGTEVGVKTDAPVATAGIQGKIDSYGNITHGAFFAFLDETKGHAVLYYDPNPSTASGAELVADITNITTLAELSALSSGDFLFV